MQVTGVLLLVSLGTFTAGAVLLLTLSRRPLLVGFAGPAVTLAGSASGIAAAILSLCKGPLIIDLPWSVPAGSAAVGMDPLSALFAVPILLISSLSAVYSHGYLSVHGEKSHGATLYWTWFNLLVGGMLLVTAARNALLFLLGWELMAIASFFLVMHEADEPEVRRAGWIYLVATHVGTACILALFAILGHNGPLDFSSLGVPIAAGATGSAATAFILAFIGFGTKAGFVPFHVWLPEAHPAAPSGVSAVMSGVMIKTGIYGLLRFLLFLGPPQPWWGWTILIAGLVSGVVGVLSALAQHDLKRLLAYHSVENVGIIAIGLGLGILGVCYGLPATAFLGFAGGLLHVFNHAIFKSLLFMGAGAVLKATGSRDLDHQGGLLRRMPVTGSCFLTGSMSICGLPPFNGFVSEFLVFLAAISGIVTAAGHSAAGSTAGLLAIGGLALIGGLAMACFTKAFGIVFLGEPRTPRASEDGETTTAMRVPMILLATACLAIGLAGPLFLRFGGPVAEYLCASLSFDCGAGPAARASGALAAVTAVSALVIVATALIMLFRSSLLRKRVVSRAPTWDCGFASPSASMQYTASSFADPVISLFSVVISRKRRLKGPEGLFPTDSAFFTETPDLYKEKIYRPAFSWLERLFSRFRVIQHGWVNLYILYIVAALIALLAWKL